MPRDPRFIETIPEAVTQRKLAESEEARRSRRGTTPLGGGAVGAPGEIGPEGKEGPGPGLLYKYETSTSTAPAAGRVRFNSATITEANNMYISETDANAGNVAALITNWTSGNSITRGMMVMRKRGAPNVYAIFTISLNREDEGTWDKIAGMTCVASNGTFNNLDEVYLELTRFGDKGTEGEKGSTGGTGPAGASVINGPKYAYEAITGKTKPGTGSFRFSKSGAELLTGTYELYIRETDIASVENEAWLKTLVESTGNPKGYLLVTQETAGEKWLMLAVLGSRTDEGEWDAFSNLAYITGPGGFVAGQPCRFQFVRTGDVGAQGIQGKEGPAGTATAKRDVWHRDAMLPAATAVNTYLMANNGITAEASGTAFIGGTRYIDPANYNISGKKTLFNLQGVVEVNATAPASTISVQLVKVTKTLGGAGVMTRTMTTLIKGTTTASAPLKETITPISSADFEIAEAGTYALLVKVTVAAVAASSMVGVSADLLVRNE